MDLQKPAFMLLFLAVLLATIFSWITDHWVVLIAVISELLAFVPAKWNGITQILVKVLTIIFGRKNSSLKSSSNKKKF